MQLALVAIETIATAPSHRWGHRSRVYGVRVKWVQQWFPFVAPPPIRHPLLRPLTRGDCLPGGHNECRPCRWVSCRYHLKYDVVTRYAYGASRETVIEDNYPGVELEDMPETCALDVVDKHTGGVEPGMPAMSHRQASAYLRRDKKVSMAATEKFARAMRAITR